MTEFKERLINAYLNHRIVRKVFHPGLNNETIRHYVTGVDSRKLGENLYSITVAGMTIQAGEYWADCIRKEWPAWKYWYLPAGGVEGKTILSVGSGCGEDMLFYFSHGAKRVIGIEASSYAAGLCIRNIQRNDWNAHVINEPFKLEHLTIHRDLTKFDIEGGEKILLDPSVKELPNSILEVHPASIGPHAEELVKKFRMKRIIDNIWTTV